MEKYDCYVSVITVFELYNGVKTKDHSKILNTIFSRIETLDFNKETAITAAEIYKKFKKDNQLIEFRDIFIAATALSENIPLSTLNLKHFERIKVLKII